MAPRILPLVALALCLAQPAIVRAQLNFEEYKVFNQLLAEPDAKPSFDRRLRLIGDALEREGDAKQRAGGTIPVDLKAARIPAADGVPFLVKRLDHSSEIVKRSAYRMLGAYGVEAKSAVPAVLKRFEQEPTPDVRAAIMLTLAKIGPTNAESAAAILERLGADDASEAMNRAALQALVAMASVVPKSAAPRVAKFLEHPTTDLGVHAYELIGIILALERPTLEQLKAMTAIEWRNAPDQGYAVLAAIADAGKKAEFAVPLVLGLLDSTPPLYLECVALDTLAKAGAGNPRAIAAFIERMPAKDISVRSHARTALHRVDLKQPEAVRALAAGLRHKDRGVQFEVAVVLRSWDEQGRLPTAAHAEMLTPLLETLGELDETVSPAHLDAYLALLRRFGPRAAPAADGLLKFYLSEADSKKPGRYGVILRGKVLAALANIGVPEAGRELVLDLLRKGPAIQIDGGLAYAAAARASGFAEPQQAIPLLLPGLTVKGPERAIYYIDWSGDGQGKPTTVRLEAIRALAKIGPPAEAALPHLQEIVEAMPEAPINLGLLAHQEARKAYQAIAGKLLPPTKGLFADGQKEVLHLDERLQVKLTLRLQNPRPLDVLKRLQQGTGLALTVDENVDPDIPVWASQQSVNMPAWIVMRQMAAAPSIQGKWEDVGDGYRLVSWKKGADERFPKNPKMPFPPFRDESEPPQKLAAEDAPPKKEYAEDYHPAFKEKRNEIPGLIIYGPDAAQCVKYEPEGMRLTLPVDYPRPRPGTGVITDFGVKGDFEITVSYELLADPNAELTIVPTELRLMIVPDERVKSDLWRKASQNRAGLARAVVDPNLEGQFIANSTKWTDDIPKDKWGNENFAKVEVQHSHHFPATANTGRLRLVRSGSLLYFFTSEGDSKDFAFLHKSEFGVKDLKNIRILGFTSGNGASLDLRITDLRIRADAFAKTATVIPMADVVEVPARRWWLIPLVIAVPFLLIVLALGIWLMMRLRRPGVPVDQAANVQVSDAIAFACQSCGKRLKVKAASAGKKLKCPGCGKGAIVPKSASDDEEEAP